MNQIDAGWININDAIVVTIMSFNIHVDLIFRHPVSMLKELKHNLPNVSMYYFGDYDSYNMWYSFSQSRRSANIMAGNYASAILKGFELFSYKDEYINFERRNRHKCIGCVGRKMAHIHIIYFVA